MASTQTALICTNFKGIRRKNSIFSSEAITASDMQNIELFNTGLNSGIGIRTAKGNIAVCSLIPDGEEVINLFESVQGGANYCFVHTESQNEGKLYLYNRSANTLESKITGLTVTQKSCGCDFAQGWSDYFIFTNGVEFYHIELANLEEPIVNWNEQGYLKGVENEDIKGLGLVIFDDRLWVFNNQRLWYSVKQCCYDFNNSTIESDDPDVVTRAGYIEFVKPITAIFPYLGALAVFHKDSSVLISVDSDSKFSQAEESPGGCAAYNSLVFHGTDLYFYDDTKKGIFSFQQVVNGDKTLGENIAYDIQEELIQIPKSDIDKIRALSIVTADRNEVWFLIPIPDNLNHSTIMIYDYMRGEWVKRKCQKINCFNIINDIILSGGTKIFEEYSGSDFDGEFIQAFYNCTPCNLGVDNSFKITKFPPRVTLDSTYNNDFYVKYIRNYDALKEPKIKHIIGKTLKNILYWDSGYYDIGTKYCPKTINAIYKLSSTTFKTLEIQFFTLEEGQEICIKAIEFSRIKIKQI